MELIHKNYCSKCKTGPPDIKVSKTGKTQYYRCNKCNTEKMRKYVKTKEGRKKVYDAVYRSIKKLQYKQDARYKIRDSIKSGKIIRPKICSVCNKKKIIEGHHPDYSKPLEVIWVCRKCHTVLDKNMVHNV